MRTKFGWANLPLARGAVGGIAVLDGGRAVAAGEDSKRVHTSAGAEFCYAALERAIVAHVLCASGERHSFYSGPGLPF